MEPRGELRTFNQNGGVTIDGAPLVHVIALAAVVAALAAIPFSVVIGSGASFPLSQAVYPLVGWLLGPIAGALATGVGAAVGTFFFPHSATIPVATVLGAMLGGFAAGTMRSDGTRQRWWLGVTLFAVAAYLLYGGRAVIVNQVEWWAVLAGSVINWTGFLLFVLPTRTLFARWIGSEAGGRRFWGLFLGTWAVAGLAHLTTATIVYFVKNWPAHIWLAFAPFAPFENALRALVGAIIGTGVIAGLHATRLVKPKQAVY